MFAPCDASGTIMRRRDGYDATGYHFYNATWAVNVDISSVDGLVECLWRGKYDIHGTTTGDFASGANRFAATTQLNKRLDQRLAKAVKESATLRVRDDAARYF